MPDPDVLEPDAGLHAPPADEPGVPAPAAAPAQEPVKTAPTEDVEGIKGALVAERRRRQELEQELAARSQPPAPKVNIPDVSDEDAETYARRYELYTAQGLDLNRAKQIIADNRKEMTRVAKEAAAEAIEPLKQTTATQASRQNFVWAASQQDADGQPLVDPAVLAQTWTTFPPELTANPAVAKVVLAAAVGEALMTRKARPRAPDREPLLSEPSGGNRGGAYTMSNVERKVAQASGIAPDKWEKVAKEFKPGQPNILE